MCQNFWRHHWMDPIYCAIPFRRAIYESIQFETPGGTASHPCWYKNLYAKNSSKSRAPSIHKWSNYRKGLLLDWRWHDMNFCLLLWEIFISLSIAQTLFFPHKKGLSIKYVVEIRGSMSNTKSLFCKEDYLENSLHSLHKRISTLRRNKTPYNIHGLAFF